MDMESSSAAAETDMKSASDSDGMEAVEAEEVGK